MGFLVYWEPESSGPNLSLGPGPLAEAIYHLCSHRESTKRGEDEGGSCWDLPTFIPVPQID